MEPKPDTLPSPIFHLLSRQRWKETLLTSIINILKNQFGFIYVVFYTKVTHIPDANKYQQSQACHN
jgi:hypothetical protein